MSATPHTQVGGTFSGIIDNVSIYNYARTPEEIRLDYNAGYSAKFGPSNKSCSQDPASCMDYGLVGNWSFDEGSGITAYDASDNSNDGTLTNSPKWTKGKKGGALNFDGKDDYINYSNDSSLNFDASGEYTIETWIKLDILPSNKGKDELIVRKHGGTGFALRVVSWSNHLCMYNPVDWSTNENDTALEADRWYHAIVVYDNQNLKFYLDGKLDKNLTPGTNFQDNISDSISISDSTDTLQGVLDEVRIYNRALSIEEVRYHYNRGAPVAHWSFDEGNGTTTYDGTENNNDGTLTVGATGANTTSSDAWVAGKHGSALNLDGTDDYVNCGNDSSLNITDAITVGAWVKLTDDTQTEQGLITKGLDGETWRFMPVGFTNSEFTFRFKGTDGAWNSEMPSTVDLTLGAWYYLIVTYDETLSSENIKLFVNGILNKTYDNTDGIFSAPSDVVTLGHGIGGAQNYFNGLVDDVSIYNYARTSEQILMDYNAGYAVHLK